MLRSCRVDPCPPCRYTARPKSLARVLKLVTKRRKCQLLSIVEELPQVALRAKGAGFLYVRRELQRDVHLLLISWGYEGDDPSFVSRHEKQGTRDPSAYLTVPAAIAWQHEHNWDSVRRR
jgi:hypothetical protein